MNSWELKWGTGPLNGCIEVTLLCLEVMGGRSRPKAKLW